MRSVHNHFNQAQINEYTYNARYALTYTGRVQSSPQHHSKEMTYIYSSIYKILRSDKVWRDINKTTTESIPMKIKLLGITMYMIIATVASTLEGF